MPSSYSRSELFNYATPPRSTPYRWRCSRLWWARSRGMRISKIFGRSCWRPCREKCSPQGTTWGNWFVSGPRESVRFNFWNSSLSVKRENKINKTNCIVQTATSDKSHKEVFETCSDLMQAIIQSPVPVIAAVDGLAAAAGCQLVAACDVAVCTERSSFSTPGYFAIASLYSLYNLFIIIYYLKFSLLAQIHLSVRSGILINYFVIEYLSVT